MTANIKRPRLFAVASGGGHWVQLMRLVPAFEEFEIKYATTMPGLAAVQPGAEVVIVRDASRTEPVELVFLAAQLLFHILVIRPDVVISTGAAPGLLALRLGKLLGARTIWVDSIANVDELSMSGVLARSCADLWLTQWEHLTERYEGLRFLGAVI